MATRFYVFNIPQIRVAMTMYIRLHVSYAIQNVHTYRETFVNYNRTNTPVGFTLSILSVVKIPILNLYKQLNLHVICIAENVEI